MTQLHLFNQYEIIGYENYNKGVQYGSFYRDLLAIEENDLYISIRDIDNSYLDYIIALKNLPQKNCWLLDASKIFPQRSFPLELAKLVKPALTKQISCFNPFIETPSAAMFAKQINLPLKWSAAEVVNSNILDKFNDKYLFKQLCEQHNVKTIPWLCARSKKSLIKAISHFGESWDKVIVKNSYNAGGYGNRAGTPEELIASIDAWFEKGIYLVEPFLDISKTIGSLAVVKNEGVEFVGLDEQIIENLQWKGCEYPYHDNHFATLIRQKTIDLGQVAWNFGIRGFLNIDWAIAKNTIDLECFAIECNFRDNGFNFILNAAKSIFRLSPEVAKIKYISNVPVRKCEKKLSAILDALSTIVINDTSIVIKTREDKEQEGLIVTSYKEGNHSIGLLLAAKTDEYLEQALAKIDAII